MWQIALCLLIALWLAQAHAKRPPPENLPGATAHVYKSVKGEELKLYVFTPADKARSEPKPAIVLFFGGGWTQGSVRQFAAQADYLARRGMVVILPDYRVFSRQGTSAIDAMADAASAVRWVRSNAAKLGIDVNRLAAGGGSAGGQLALSTALMPQFAESGENTAVSSRPNALVLFNPVVDVSKWRARFGDRVREASPLLHASPGLPPTLILHGKADTTAPYADVEQFCAEARAQKERCEVVGYEKATHGFFNTRSGPVNWYSETAKRADQFLVQLGYLKVEANTAAP